MPAGPRPITETRPDRDPKPPSTPHVPQILAYRAFVRNAPIAVAMFDRKMRVIEASPQFLSDCALTADQAIGRSSYDLAPGSKELYGDLHKRCLEGASESSEATRIALPNGLHRWMMWDIAPWRDDADCIGGLLVISRDITAQKEAEEEVRRTRAFLTTVIDNVPAPLAVKEGGTGKFLMLNRAGEEMLGLGRQEHEGKTGYDLFPTDQARLFDRQDQEVLASGRMMVIEEEAIATSDGPRFLRTKKLPIRNDDGPDYLLAISEDITERKKADEELQRARAFLSMVVENTPLAMVVKDGATGRVLMTNRAMETMYGVPRERHVGRRAEDMLPADVAAKITAEDRQILETGLILTVEELEERPGGVTRMIRKTKTAVKTPDGSSVLLAISEDVTDRIRTHDELERTRAFLTTVIDNMPAGLSVKDAETGRVLMLNRAIEEMYGVERGENVGKTGAEVFTSEQAAQFDEFDRETIRSGELRVFDEQPIVTPRNGVRYLRKKKLLVPNPEGGGDFLLGITEDVTERREAEAALKDALTRAEAASVAKSEFLANMSHEIRTPLNGVLGLADALSRMELQPKQHEIVEMILGSGKALTMILGDVLDLAKAEAGALELNAEAFSLRETIGSAAFLFETVARDKDLEFRVVFEGEGPDRLVGDALRIKQVVSNLISNAVKFTSHGGVTVTAGCVTGPNGEARLRVEVADTGPGFSEDVAKRLFSRFEQGDGSITRRFGGTGLGLSIAGTLAQMMDGDISCSAAAGKGATFSFTARLRTATPSAAETHAENTPATEMDRPLRVLLAEDHAVNQQVVQLMLGGMAEIVIAADGQQAVDAFVRSAPFDVVLMDTQMPVMDGMTATRAIREHEQRLGRPRIPIISLTANAMAHQVQACMEAGADFHLAKPITFEGLIGAIRTAVEGAEESAEQSRVA